MIIAPERFASRRDTLAFLICVLLAIAARVAPPVAQQTVASAITSSILAPFLAIQEQAVLMRTARTRVAQFVSARDSALVDSLQLFMLWEENNQLRELLSLSGRLPVQHVSAEVLHQASPADHYSLLLSAGRDLGIDSMAPVIAPGGLVGVVRSVGPGTSVAALWSHPDFAVSAMTADGTVFGILAPRGSAGPNTSLMELRGIPYREEVPVGSLVYTSGRGIRFGGVFPRGIPIGVIQAVAEESVGWSKTYIVQPAVQPGSLSHVVILTGVGDAVESAFDSGEIQ